MNERENRIIIAGFSDKGGGNESHTPTEAAEGINTGVSDLELSKTQIETLDLLSEGEIQGLVTGEYSNTGVLGEIGWRNVTFTPNNVAIGTEIRWLQSIFWNDTPVVDKTGRYNFQQIIVNTSKGNPNGTNISDGILDELTVTRLISERLYGGGENFAKIYRILDKECIGAIVNLRVTQLAEQNTQGDILPTTVTYSLYYRPIFNNRSGGNFIVVPNNIGRDIGSIYGKITNGYIRTRRINFDTHYSSDDTFLGWEIKVVRWTEDSTTSRIRNQTFVDSLTEIYGSKFIYPNSAIVSSLFDAQYFSNVPARTYLNQGLKVKVPDTYDPIYKTYDESAGPWQGTFKEDNSSKILKEWTDNPAWCYYDLITNKRYGLGNYVDEDFVDKFTLYEIGKYCDTLVSDGYGSLEPRFTCNAYITSQEEAYKMVNSMASIFRGITYYSAGQIYTVQDSEKSPIYQFTNANVVEGDFTYSSSAKKARHTVAIVRYNDKKNFYKPALEYVEDIDAIRKYGLRDVEVPAFGCTSRGQAIRLGRWALLTESLETESINFRAGLDVAGFLRPGDVFQIYDSNRKAQRLGGRLYNIVVSPTSSNLTLDSEVTGLTQGTTYKLSLLTPTFYYDPSQVTQGLDSSGFASGFRRSNIQYLTFNNTNATTVSGRTNLIINQPLDYTNYDVSGNYVWMIEATGSTVFGNILANEWDTYRVINIKENDTHVYEIDGLQYDVSKFLQIESGFSFTDSVFGGSLVFASPDPNSLILTETKPTPHSSLINYSFTISNKANIRGYRVFTKRGSDFSAADLINPDYIAAELPANTTNGTYLPSQDGLYYFRVYSVGNNGSLSASYAANNINILNINPLQDITINSLQLYTGTLINNAAGTQSSTIFSSSSPQFTWQAGIGGLNNIPSDLSYRITIRKPSNSNIPDQEIYFQETGYTSSSLLYTFQFTGNYNAESNLKRRGPFREFDVVVEAMTNNGYSSAGGQFTPQGQDSSFSNANGYDILYANNPQPQAICLYTGDTDTAFYQTGKATQEWITQDGEIKIFFTNSGNTTTFQEFFEDDIAGATLYYSNVPFSPDEATQRIPTNKVIRAAQITSNNNPIIFPANLTHVEREYITIAPFDDFDVGISSRPNNNNYLITGLNPCAPVWIEQKISNVGAYKAWVEFDVGLQPNGVTWGLFPTWQNKKFNITDNGVRAGTFTTPQGQFDVGIIEFEEPMSSSNYAINISTHRFHEPGFFGGAPSLSNTFVQVYAQDRERIYITSFDNMFGGASQSLQTGRCFIGILSL